jgi:hypothetical protein
MSFFAVIALDPNKNSNTKDMLWDLIPLAMNHTALNITPNE